ncbi:MAG: hypothetical protein ACODAD_00095 [Planctomycetota bacterium]
MKTDRPAMRLGDDDVLAAAVRVPKEADNEAQPAQQSGELPSAAAEDTSGGGNVSQTGPNDSDPPPDAPPGKDTTAEGDSDQADI